MKQKCRGTGQPDLIRHVGAWKQGLCPICGSWVVLFQPSGRLRAHRDAPQVGRKDPPR